jgi:hypothetical protein
MRERIAHELTLTQRTAKWLHAECVCGWRWGGPDEATVRARFAEHLARVVQPPKKRRRKRRLPANRRRDIPW